MPQMAFVPEVRCSVDQSELIINGYEGKKNAVIHGDIHGVRINFK
jgi:hypothetical protein